MGFALIATVATMMALSPLIAVAVLVLVPLVLVPAELVGTRNRELNHDRNRIMGEMSSHVAERLSVGGTLLARIFGGQKADLVHWHTER